MYLDDILMNNQSAQQHKAHVYEVFKKIQDYGFKLRGKLRFFFLMEKITYLGQIIDKDSEIPDQGELVR